MAHQLNPLDQFIAARVAFRMMAKPVVPTTVEEAAKLLGVSPDASDSEVDKAYKALALKNHPDLGGDPDRMVEFNVARDLLKGTRTPSRPLDDYGKSPPVKREWKKIEVTLEEALAASGVPSNVKWVFATNTGHGDREMGAFSIRGIVYYGTTDTEHVFLSIRRENGQNAFDLVSIDTYYCESKRVPISQPIATVAPKMIRVMFDHINGLRKGYNAKVTVLPDNFNLKGTSSPMYPKGKEMSFKDAMINLGLVGEEHAWKTNQKISVIFSYKKNLRTGEKTITLDINGKNFELNPKSTNLLFKWPQMLKAIYGDRIYVDQKKTITRNRNGKEILTTLATKLTSEPQELLDLLAKAAEQMK